MTAAIYLLRVFGLLYEEEIFGKKKFALLKGPCPDEIPQEPKPEEANPVETKPFQPITKRPSSQDEGQQSLW